VEAGRQGRLDTSTLTPLLAGIILLGIFMVRAPRVEHPLLDLKLYRNGSFRLASMTTFALGGVIFGSTILFPLYVQLARGQGAMAGGLVLTVQGIGMAIAMLRASGLYNRFGPGVVLGGTALALVATLPLIFVSTGTPYWLLGALMAIRGAGIGLSSMPVMSAAYAALDPSHSEEVSTQLNVLQRLGGSLAIAVLVVLLHQQMGDALRTGDHGAVAHAFGASFAGTAAVTLLAVIPALFLTLAHNRRAKPTAGDA
jgi:Na+/melibiose symporter-like transporter